MSLGFLGFFYGPSLGISFFYSGNTGTNVETHLSADHACSTHVEEAQPHIFLDNYDYNHQALDNTTELTTEPAIPFDNTKIDIPPEWTELNSVNSPIIEPVTDITDRDGPVARDFVYDDDFQYNISTNSDASSVSDGSEKESIDDSCLPSLLCNWASEFNVSMSSLTALLHLLHDFHSNLPLDARTLLGTPRDLRAKDLSGRASYYHFGMKSGIEKCLENSGVENSGITEISIQINIDGLPIFKSSSYVMWPILGKLQDPFFREPFVIGIYAGNKKTVNLNDYLQDFLEEATTLEKQGFSFKNIIYKFKIHSFVCDAPARSYIKNTKSHNGYSGCDRCTQNGVWLKKVTFPETNAALRTDKSFRDMTDEEHHLNLSIPSPLTN